MKRSAEALLILFPPHLRLDLNPDPSSDQDDSDSDPDPDPDPGPGPSFVLVVSDSEASLIFLRRICSAPHPHLARTPGLL